MAAGRSRKARQLTELEGHVLAQIWRHQPITAYGIRKLFSGSPVQSLSSSAGVIYPVVERLVSKKLVSAAKTRDKRATRNLSCTPAGLDAIAGWVDRFSASAMLVQDPLRTRAMFLDALPRERQLDWLRQALAETHANILRIRDYEAGAQAGPFEAFAHRNALAHCEVQRDWLAEMISFLETAQPPPDRAPG